MNVPMSGMAVINPTATPRLTGSRKVEQPTGDAEDQPVDQRVGQRAEDVDAPPASAEEDHPAHDLTAGQVVEQAQQAEHVATSKAEQEQRQHAGHEVGGQLSERPVDRFAAHRLVDPLDEVGDPRRDVDVRGPVVAFLESNGGPRRRLLEVVDRRQELAGQSGDDTDDDGDQRDDDHDDTQRTGKQPIDEVHEGIDEQGDERAGDDPPDDLMGSDEDVAQR